VCSKHEQENAGMFTHLANPEGAAMGKLRDEKFGIRCVRRVTSALATNYTICFELGVGFDVDTFSDGIAFACAFICEEQNRYGRE
jgi:hypothetical protein